MGASWRPERMSPIRGTPAILTVASTLVLVAACGASGASTAPSEAGASAGPSGAAAVYELKVATGAQGAYITGEDGKSLYMLMTDSATTSTCTGTCAGTWPPFTLDPGESTKAGDGVTGTIATFTRADGSTQVTINGHELYYFSGDSAAGQTNGQGVG